jgi:hypothetical protein
MRGMAKVMDKDADYFVAWMQEDNEKQPTMPYEAARGVYKYRVFRADRGISNTTPITEAMTYDEAQAKLKEIILLTEGSEYVKD